VQKVCEELGVVFGEGHRFTPEGITEGGILWEEWPGKQPNDYKSFRLYIKGWPWVSGGKFPQDALDNRLEPVEHDSQASPWCPRVFVTYLKAFHGAPTWKAHEIGKFAEAFERVVPYTLCTKYPRKNALQHAETLPFACTCEQCVLSAEGGG
jgi:hypothetical protein